MTKYRSPLLLRLLIWPIRMLWRATMPRSYPHGKPFYMSNPLVIDGDTVWFEGRKIRLWGMDAPEMGQRHGAAAKAELQRLLDFRRIYVIPMDTDKYGRIVAQIHCGRGDIGQTMVRRGYAVGWNGAYARDEKKARRRRRGLWRRGGISSPAAYRAKNKTKAFA